MGGIILSERSYKITFPVTDNTKFRCIHEKNLQLPGSCQAF